MLLQAVNNYYSSFGDVEDPRVAYHSTTGPGQVAITMMSMRACKWLKLLQENPDVCVLVKLDAVSYFIVM